MYAVYSINEHAPWGGDGGKSFVTAYDPLWISAATVGRSKLSTLNYNRRMLVLLFRWINMLMIHFGLVQLQ